MWFSVQIVAVGLSCLVQVGVKEWLLAVVPDLCDPHQASFLICPSTTVFYGSSIIWLVLLNRSFFDETDLRHPFRGLIGPARQFAVGMMYNPILYWLLIGLVLPIPFYFLGKRYPNSWLQYVNIPVIFAGAVYMPPATGINYSSWFLFGFIFRKPLISGVANFRS